MVEEPDNLVPKVPREVATTVNLLAHPLAGAMAFSALGLGLASHAVGLWAGAIAGAASASRRLLPQLLENMESAAEEAAEATGYDWARPVQDFAAPPLKAENKDAARAVPLKLVDAAASAPQPVAPTPRPVPKVSGRRAASAGPANAAAAPQPQAAARTKPAVRPRPRRVDDLKVISGIGPKLEAVLNGLGIWTYAQIAALSTPEVAWLDDHLGFKGRIERDGWVAQAGAAAGKR